MRRPIVAVIAIGSCVYAVGSTQASAFGLYRKDGYVAYHAGPGHYCFRGPRWGFSAAYYQSYRTSYRYRRVRHWQCRC